MKKQTITLSTLTVIAALLLTACGSAALPVTSLPDQPATAQAPVASGASGDLLEAYQGTLENVYTAVNPSVVNIRVVQKVDASMTTAVQPFFNLPQGQDKPSQQYQSGLGSGFVWDKEGHIVTNNHVVSDADKIEVTFNDGMIVPATLVGADPDSDLAVIKVDVTADKLHPVQVGDSNAVKVGQLAIAIGNPFGLKGTMTTGIISAVGRSLPADETAAQSYTIPDVIQTDAPINPGNSGGVLIDSQGFVIGVTSAIESPVRANAGIGFAIPSAIVDMVVPQLVRTGTYIHPWLGISGVTLTPDLAKAMKLDSDQWGVLIEEVQPNSPAEDAGLRGSTQNFTLDGQNTNIGGDVITAINNQPVNGMNDLIAYLASSTIVEQTVTLTYIRDGEEDMMEVTLSARPTVAERSATNIQPAANGIKLGILGMTVDETIIKEMNLKTDQKGVLVQEVQSDSLADTAGLRAGSKSITINGQNMKIGGDIITGVNGQPIASIEELKTALAQLTSNQELRITLVRDGKEIQIAIQPGQ